MLASPVWCLWWSVALAAEVQVAATEGVLRPGMPATLVIGVADDEGRPALRPPKVDAAGAALRLDESVAPGVWSVTVTPAREGTLAVTVEVDGVAHTASLPVEPLSASLLSVPARVNGTTGAAEVTVHLDGDVPADAIAVAVGGGTVLGVDAAGGGLDVRIAPEASAFPRFVPVGVLDLRTPDPPAWTGVRLRTRPPVSLQTEPGSKVSLTVGSRAYGPFTADAQGHVSATIEQYPGELQADVLLVDDLGNETRSVLPLATWTQPALVALPSGPLVPGRPPPVVWLRAVHGDGHPWLGSTPTCRGSGVGELRVERVDKGTWLLPLGELRLAPPQDVRVVCALGSAAETSFRVETAPGLPTRLRLRVWPEELSADFPVAEVTAVLENPAGDRLPATGIELSAELGRVTAEPAGATSVRGEYRGEAAVATGRDVIAARYHLPPGTGSMAAIVVGHGEVPRAGLVPVHGRALDPGGRPLAGVAVTLSAGAGDEVATTGSDGWASALCRLPPGIGPVVVTATADRRIARMVAIRDGEAFDGPGEPELVATRVVPITTGRATRLFISVDPPVLYTGSRSVAIVRVGVYDRAGNPVPDASVRVEASEGTVSALVADGDASFRAEYSPPVGERPREVSIVASADDSSATARLILEPRPVDRAPGIGLGILSNLGAITSPLLTFDVDFRTPWFGRSLMLRFGAATYSDSQEVDTGFGPPLRVRMSVVPLSVGVLGRRETGGRALWLGITGVVAPISVTSRFGDEQATRGLSVLPPGLALIGGLGQRFGGGEVMLELRATALSSRGGPVAYDGPVGGVAAVLGYRLVY